MRAYEKKRKEKTLRQRAFSSKKEHDKSVKGKKIILVQHPTEPRTWIEKIIQ
jgi:hypothetical protein